MTLIIQPYTWVVHCCLSQVTVHEKNAHGNWVFPYFSLFIWCIVWRTEDGRVFLLQIKTRIWEREMAEQSREVAYLKSRCSSLSYLFMGVSRDDSRTVCCLVEYMMLQLLDLWKSVLFLYTRLDGMKEKRVPEGHTRQKPVPGRAETQALRGEVRTTW